MTNDYPGRCACGEWVPAEQGVARPPPLKDRHRGRFSVVCFLCMTPGEQALSRRHTDRLTGKRQAESVSAPTDSRRGSA